MTKLLARAALIVMVFTFIAGVGSLISGISSYRQSRKAKPQPQIITAANLIAHGPGDNHFVQVTNLIPQVDSIVVEGGDRKTHWDTAYIPLTASDDNDADDAPRIILVTTSPRDQSSLDDFAKTRVITGMVSAWNIDDQTKGAFKSAYPKLDTAKCYILTQDAVPPSKNGSVVCMTFGVGLLAFTFLLATSTRRGNLAAVSTTPSGLAASSPFQPSPPIRIAPITVPGEQKSTISPFVANLRKKVGNDLLMLIGINAVVLNDQRQILLVRSKETGHWMPIGGMIEPGEEPANAAIREVFEETSIRITPEKLVGVYDGPAVEYANGDRVHYITIVFLCKAGPGVPYPQDGENSETRYFDIDKTPPMREDHQRNIDQALSNKPQAAFKLTT